MAAQNEVDDMIKRIQSSKGVQGRLFYLNVLNRIIFVFLKRINYN